MNRSMSEAQPSPGIQPDPRVPRSRRFTAFVLALFLLSGLLPAGNVAAAAGASWVELFEGLAAAWFQPTEEAIARIDEAAGSMADRTALAVAACWKEIYLDPDYTLYLYGKDDPADLPITGKHAFVVLGYQLSDGEMAEELIGRCDAAAAAALAFPDSIIVASGGATGSNNPKQHTEAGLIKNYLFEQHGISEKRVFTDEKAKTTAENATNTLTILKEQGIETFTIVTSAYHQKRGITLYNAAAALEEQYYGYQPRIIGNFCYDAPMESGKTATEQNEMLMSLYQLGQILKLPDEQMTQLRKLLRP